jgi:DNA polymerase-3 subunit gamma/tau
MLSIGAFNALLKTLEEPPAHAKFIFATTNPEKVPLTILSRCQRFDFVRISFNLIVGKLKKIVSAEKLNVSEEAVFTITRASDGSLRDAESILDQLASFSKEKISNEDVINLLGMIEEDKLAEVVESLYRRDTKAALQAIDNIVNKGKDISQFIIGLMDYIRNMMVLAVSSDLRPLIDFPESYVDILKEQLKNFKIEELLYIFYTLSSTLNAVRKSEIARFILEAAFMKLSMRSELISLADISEKLRSFDIPNNGRESRLPERIPERMREIAPERPPEKKGEYEKGGAIEVDMVKRAWPEILQTIKAKKISIASYLSEGEITGIEGSSVIFGFSEKFNFHREVLDHAVNRRFVEGVISETLSKDIQIKFITVQQGESNKTAESPPAAKPETADDSIIQSALEIFNGKIVRVREDNQRQ